MKITSDGAITWAKYFGGSADEIFVGHDMSKILVDSEENIDAGECCGSPAAVARSLDVLSH